MICTTWVAPKVMADAICSSRLTTAITFMPASCATCMNIRPIGPAPITTTLSPRFAPVSSRPRTTQASGSVSAACSKRQALGHNERVLGDDPGGNADVLGIGAVVEEQVLAEVFLSADAPVTGAAGRRIQRHHAHARLEAAHACARLVHHSRHFMSEESRRSDHPGVVSAAKNLQVGAASERGVDRGSQSPPSGGGEGNPFNPDIFFAVKHGSVHLT